MSAGIIVGLIFNLLGGSDPDSPFLITWVVDNIFDVIQKEIIPNYLSVDKINDPTVYQSTISKNEIENEK